MAEPLLRIEGLTKSFFGVEVLHGVGFALDAGRVLGLVGENGSGKSTTMNILGGVHQPDGGTMWLSGQSYQPRGPRDAAAAGIAFIHQELNLFKNLSIEENLFIGGSSVFATSGQCNPTTTIVALAIRLGHHLASIAA